MWTNVGGSKVYSAGRRFQFEATVSRLKIAFFDDYLSFTIIILLGRPWLRCQSHLQLADVR